MVLTAYIWTRVATLVCDVCVFSCKKFSIQQRVNKKLLRLKLIKLQDRIGELMSMEGHDARDGWLERDGPGPSLLNGQLPYKSSVQLAYFGLLFTCSICYIM